MHPLQKNIEQISSGETPVAIGDLGLIDASNPTEFDTKMESLREEWKKRHPQRERFLTYFNKYKGEEIKKTMTAEVRSMTGLGFPPGVYDQNGKECMNSVL